MTGAPTPFSTGAEEAPTRSPAIAATPTPPSAPPSAPLMRRLAAAGYEALLLGAVLLLAGLVLAPAISPAPGASVHRPLPIPSFAARALSFAALLGVGALYFGWSWSGGRRTLPMKTWRMRLVRRDGAAVTPRTALLRYGAAWIGPAAALLAYAALAPGGHGGAAPWLAALNYAWALVDPAGLFLHDRIAGTRIVADPPPHPA